jgi:hypothetical protein
MKTDCSFAPARRLLAETKPLCHCEESYKGTHTKQTIRKRHSSMSPIKTDCFVRSCTQIPRRDETTLSLRGFSQGNSFEAISKLGETDCFPSTMLRVNLYCKKKIGGRDMKVMRNKK